MSPFELNYLNSIRTEIIDTDGDKVLSESFPIDRDVVQGDITSPIYFILTLELIIYKYDKTYYQRCDTR